MADLDDFFAKKDKKRSKTKTKFSTTEDVAKKLESDASKKPEKPAKKEKSQEGDDPTAEKHDQDEWKDFEEEKKDYTGLKIGNLTINPQSENGAGADGSETQEIIYDEAGNEVEKQVGPWKRMESTHVGGGEPPKVVEEKKPDPTGPMPNVVGSAYVPPSKRNQPDHHQERTLQPTRLRHKAAPDIHNEEYFPTLAGNKDGRR